MQDLRQGEQVRLPCRPPPRGRASVLPWPFVCHIPPGRACPAACQQRRTAVFPAFQPNVREGENLVCVITCTAACVGVCVCVRICSRLFPSHPHTQPPPRHQPPPPLPSTAHRLALAKLRSCPPLGTWGTTRQPRADQRLAHAPPRAPTAPRAPTHEGVTPPLLGWRDLSTTSSENEHVGM